MSKLEKELAQMVSDVQSNKEVKQSSKEQEEKQEKEVQSKNILNTLREAAIDAKWAIQDAGSAIVDKVKDVADFVDEVTLPKRIEKRLEKEEKQLKKEELEKANAIFNESYISEEVVNYIKREANIGEIAYAVLISEAKRAKKWISYALHCMTYDKAELIEVNNEEGKFVNAIADYFGFCKIYNNIPIGNIMDYDISRKGSAGFLMSVEDLREISENEEIKEKIARRKNSGIKLATEQEKKLKQERMEHIKALANILKWTPFYKYSIIGFRRLRVYGGQGFDCIELVDDNGEKFYMYHNKNLYIGGSGGYLGCTMRYPYPSETCFTYSPIDLDKLTYALEVLLPKFASLSYEVKEPRDIYSRIKEVLEQDFTLKNHGMGSNILCEDELELLSDDMLNDFCEKCKRWKDGSYSQYFEPKAYETWRNRLESIGAAAEKEWINRAEKQEQVKQEAQKQMEAQLREEELKGKQEAGNAGEQEVEYQLKWLPKEYMAVEKKTSGILLAHPDFGNEKQEIDHIVVGPQGVFLIETKAYSGTIRIDAQGNWTRSKGDGIEEGLRNPVAQVNRHHLVVEKILGISEIYDIICIANDKSIIEGAENSVVPVVKSDMLGHYISNYKTDSGKMYSEGEIKELKARLESNMSENEA